MTNNDTDIVAALRLALAKRVGQERYDLWFSGGTCLLFTPSALQIHVSNRFKLDWLRGHFSGDIEAVAVEVLGYLPTLEFRVDASLDQPGTKPSPDQSRQVDAKPARADNPASSPKTSRRSFASLDTFVEGDANRLAMTSARMVVGRPGELSPLLIHGPTGTGKTHLLEGIWSAARRRERSQRVMYLSAEQFTSYFLQALRGSGLPNFRRKYRHLDLLIIDDVHFFAGKRATLVELLHTIDTLAQAGRQLVFAADRPVAEITGMGPELVARITGGLVCGITRPDLKTRQAIARQMARRWQLDVPENVLSLIATHTNGDARQLSGALCRLRAVSQVCGEPICRKMAEEALREWITVNATAVRLADIERAVCDVLELDCRTLRCGRKARGVTHPRMLAMWLARKHTRSALSEIGQYFGLRSHGTVISAQKRVNTWMNEGVPIQCAHRQWKVKDAVQEIEGRLRIG